MKSENWISQVGCFSDKNYDRSSLRIMMPSLFPKVDDLLDSLLKFVNGIHFIFSKNIIEVHYFFLIRLLLYPTFQL